MAELCAQPCGGAKTGGGGGGGGYQRQGKNEYVGICGANTYIYIKLQRGAPSMIPKSSVRNNSMVNIWIGFFHQKMPNNITSQMTKRGDAFYEVVVLMNLSLKQK